MVTHNTAHYIALHYLEFIRRLLERGYQVLIVAPEDPAFATLRTVGAQCHHLPLSRRGMNPLRELYSVYRLWRIVRTARPLILFNYSIKPVIYGSFVAGLCRVPYAYSMVTGLGYMFGRGGVKGDTLKKLVIAFYKRVLKHNTRVFFQNAHDRDVFIDNHLMESDRAVVVNGTGIDLNEFKPATASKEPVFLLISRMLWEKGIDEFVTAARLVKQEFDKARFQLLGPIDDNPAAIQADQLRQWQREGAVEYLGETSDVRPYLKQALVFVLPSYYREGRPRSILEAMAMGKPVVTTDWPGCRDPVVDGVNGYLVPVRDSAGLAAAMRKFLTDPGLALDMGRESRKMAEKDYDVHQVNKRILSYFPKTGLDSCCAG